MSWNEVAQLLWYCVCDIYLTHSPILLATYLTHLPYSTTSAVMQVYLKSVLESFLHPQPSVRMASLHVVNLILRQGLVHPVQVGKNSSFWQSTLQCFFSAKKGLKLYGLYWFIRSIQKKLVNLSSHIASIMCPFFFSDNVNLRQLFCSKKFSIACSCQFSYFVRNNWLKSWLETWEQGDFELQCHLNVPL